MHAAHASSIIRFAGKERAASELDDIDQLVQRYRARLLRFVAFSIGDPDLAQSIVQDCFLKAYNARESFRGECNVQTWLNRIALNMILDHQRTRKFSFWRAFRKTALDITEIASTLPSGAETPEKNLLVRERQHYDFGFVRNDFLGTVHTQVFDVLPKKKTGVGRFSGRIWIEDQDGAVVRLNRIFSGNDYLDRPHYFHYDSWRVNLQPGVWLPAEIYVEETHRDRLDDEPELRARTSFWGYSLKLPSHETENTAIRIDDVTDKSDAAEDISPLQASRAWVAQAEANVLDRLVQAGVLAPAGDFDKVLETVTNNLIIGNNLNLPDAVHCRVLLTTPLESLAVGNTILLSSGLVDVLPYEEDLAAVLSFQLAHVTLGHHVDTRYAFNDRLLFPDEVTFQRITRTTLKVTMPSRPGKLLSSFITRSTRIIFRMWDCFSRNSRTGRKD
jgi:RNA polymerase sigma factor (sigma-70 family)